MLPACDGSKRAIHELFSAGPKASWRIFFTYSLRNMGKNGVAAQCRTWTVLCCKRRRTLKKSAAEDINLNPTDRGRIGGKIYFHEDCLGVPTGVTVTGSTSWQVLLKNSRKIGEGFLTATVRHLYLNKEDACKSAKKSANGFNIFTVGRRTTRTPEVSPQRRMVKQVLSWRTDSRSQRPLLLLA